MARITQAQLAQLDMPKEFRYYGEGMVYYYREDGVYKADDISKAVRALIKWAIDNSLGLKPRNYDWYLGRGGNNEYCVPTYFDVLIGEGQAKITEQYFGKDPNLIKLTAGKCDYCDRYLVRLKQTDDGFKACNICRPECECGGIIDRGYIYALRKPEAKDEYGRLRITEVTRTKCNNCEKATKCRYCNHSYTEEMPFLEVAGQYNTCCQRCYALYVCPDCNSYQNDGRNIRRGGSSCNGCTAKKVAEKYNDLRYFDDVEVPVHGSILIEERPDRPIRVVSIETEVDGNKDHLAQLLFSNGIVPEPVVCSYGSHPDLNSDWAAFLKHDGSVTGGELITWLMELNKPEHAEAFMEVLVNLKALERGKAIAYNSNCGGHIHIDAHQFGLNDMWRLALVFGYIEDIIYRLAGAGKDYSHRSLDPNHDRANGHGGYANKTIKGPFGTSDNVYRALRGQQRMCGLNFTPYWGAVSRCRCGAAMNSGDIKNCTCNLGKCTIEWRVWNSQGNPRILHAWIALMQAVHSWCERNEGVTADQEGQFPPFEWKKKYIKDLPDSHIETTKERLTWMFENLPLTPNEKDSLIYTLELTEYGKDNRISEFLSTLRDIEGPLAPEVKKQGVALRACRKQDILIAIDKERKRSKKAPRAQRLDNLFVNVAAGPANPRF